MKKLILITTMVIAMSTNADNKGNSNPAPVLEKGFGTPIEKTVNQHSLDFFRIWLLDESGKKTLQRALEEKAGLDAKRAVKAIQFMDQTINHIDEQTRSLYTKQTAIFVSQYNESLPTKERVTSFKEINVDRATLLNAEAIIQSQLYDIAENQVSRLGDVIGEEYALDLKHWIMTSGALGHSVEPVDPQEYLKEISEDGRPDNKAKRSIHRIRHNKKEG